MQTSNAYAMNWNPVWKQPIQMSVLMHAIECMTNCRVVLNMARKITPKVEGVVSNLTPP